MSRSAIFISHNPFGRVSGRKVEYLSQSKVTIWNGCRLIDLTALTKRDAVNREIANIIALPLIPSIRIRHQFRIVATKLLAESRLFLPFVNYVRRTYLNNSRFPIKSWNHYDHLGTRPRTTNHLEGTHRQYKTWDEILIIAICNGFNAVHWLMTSVDIESHLKKEPSFETFCR